MDNKEITPSESQNNPRKIDIISLFEKDSTFLFTYKKSQKLTSALYMLTSFFSDDEPLKWTIRELGNTLVSMIIGIKDRMANDREGAMADLRMLVVDILSRLEIAQTAGLVSDMNLALINKEFGVLLDSLFRTPFSALGGKISLPESFFDAGTLPLSQTSNSEEMSFKELPISNQYVKDNKVSATKNYKTNNNSESIPKDKKTNRQKTIIELLRKKPQATIKDIVIVVKDCSEKTVQRELLALVKDGVLKKEGERRWSRYSLL